MYDLQKIFEECVSQVKSAGTPVGDIKKIEWKELSNEWGACYKKKVDGKLQYRIEINTRFLNEQVVVKELRDTVCHEILHTYPRCWNHTKTCVEYALRMVWMRNEIAMRFPVENTINASDKVLNEWRENG